jgi:hypothetical protein
MVKANVRKELSVPSVTSNEMFKVPTTFRIGVITAVQFGAVPPHTTAVSNTKAELLLVIESELSQVSGESTSLIVTLIFDVDVFRLTVWELIAAITGASLTAEIVKLTGAEFDTNRPVLTV